ncbi:MAG: hypothetical protein EXR79_14425 [Myxococcales bacterium]|nr:hypothetical protein [Myxococcales bacterium]
MNLSMKCGTACAMIVAGCATATPGIQPSVSTAAPASTDAALAADAEAGDATEDAAALDAGAPADADPRGADALAGDTLPSDATAANGEDAVGDGGLDPADADAADPGAAGSDVAGPDADGLDAVGTDAAVGDGPALDVPTPADVPPADVVKVCPPGKCDDGKPCTMDGCNSVTGACTNAAVPGCGLVAPPCAGPADCKQGVCDVGASACVGCAKAADCGPGHLCVLKACKPAPACLSDAQCKATQQVCAKAEAVCVDCDAPTDCAPGETCSAHQCVAAQKACTSSKDCTGVCDKANGQCVGCVQDADCAPSQYCAGQQCVPDVCGGPACGGTSLYACKASGSGYEAPKVCDDGIACTDNGCASGTGCMYPANGVACSDGDPCTDADKCAAGKCVGGAKVACDDKNGCTDDKCEAGKGCVATANAGPCDDGSACTTADKCAGGGCLGGVPKPCGDQNPCTEDSCDAKLGCESKPAAYFCDDGKPCTVGDQCKLGVCTAGAAKVCQDGNDCTADACDQGSGACVFAKKPGCVPASLPPCNLNTDCAGGFCAPSLRTCVECAKSADCGTGAICQKHTCKPAPVCNSDVQCKATKQVCHGVAKVCVDCASNLDCGGNQACVESACVTAPPCKSSKECAKVCDVQAGACVECMTSVDCDKGLWCNANRQCEVALCKASGCVAAAVFACKTDGAGYEAGKACQDGNACTDDGCEVAKGCAFAPNAVACDAGVGCGGKCTAGTCQAGAGPTLFDKTFGGPHDEVSEDVAAVPGGWLVAGHNEPNGSTNAGWILKVDAAGQKVWDNTYSNIETVYGLAPVDATGETGACGASYSSANKQDGWLARLKADGSVAWEKSLGSTGTDRLTKVRWLGDGFAAAGRFEKSGKSDVWVVRSDAAGAVLWNLTYGVLASTEYGYALAPAADGGLLVIGRTYAKGAGDADVWLVRLDKAGKQLWDKTYGDTKYDTGSAITEIAGGYVLGGASNVAGGSNDDTWPWLARIDAQGTALWSATYPAPGGSFARAVAALPDGGVAATGQWNDNSPQHGQQVLFLRVDAKGKLLVERTYGGPGDEDGAGIVAVAGGGFVLAADDESKGAGGANMWVMKMDPWGNANCAESGVCGATLVPACDDSKVCTLDACDPFKGCIHTVVAGCCENDAACSDGEKTCTVDACVNAECEHAYTGAAGCCNPWLLKKDFEDGTLAPLSATSTFLSKWQVWGKGKAYGGKWAAWYGNPAKGTYDDGKTYGALVLPTLAIPLAGKASLRFRLYQDTEIGKSYDVFEVHASSGGSDQTLWASHAQTSMKAAAWQAWVVDLAAFAGKSVELTFRFDTVDDLGNKTGGVFVDDVVVEKTCP